MNFKDGVVICCNDLYDDLYMICIFLALSDCGLLLLVVFYLILDSTISYSGFL